MLRNLIERGQALRAFQRALYRGTPLKDGREVRKIARLVRYHADAAQALIDGAVPFEPLETYPERAASWAKGRAR